LWEPVDGGGYIIHDYHDYNPTKEEMLKTREERAKAGRQGGLKSAASKREAKAKQLASKEEAKENPVPAPVPAPVPLETPPTVEAEKPPDKPPPKKQTRQRRKKPPPPEAVKVFRTNSNLYPPGSWYDDIVAAVGTAPADLEFWGDVVKAYVGCGWNPKNVKGMLEFYKRREIPDTNKKGKKEPAAFEVIRNWGRSHGIELEEPG